MRSEVHAQRKKCAVASQIGEANPKDLDELLDEALEETLWGIGPFPRGPRCLIR